ncbi:MAG: HAMP domain-containing histidine kinase [Candidatus Thermoplasmatota archaeon]|nr:HAMP domain-containing histidine kinase [Candidatus Thermoplasmatota archaeon]
MGSDEMQEERRLITSKTILPLSFVLGVIAWFTDALIDYMMFYQGSFFQLLIYDVPPHELYIRTVWMSMLILFGYIISRGMRQREKDEKRIHRLNNLLKSLGDVNQMLLEVDRSDEMIRKACEILYRNRGYYNVWIALFNENNRVRDFAEAGLEKKRDKLEEMIHSRQSPSCVKRVKENQGLISIEDPSKKCKDCPLSDMYQGRGSFVLGLRYQGKIYGLISASIPKRYLEDEQERSIFEELADDISYGLYNLKMEEKREKMVEKEEFLHSVLRHDLKNKIQVVQGYLQVLKEKNITDETKEYVKKAMKGARKGINLIEKVRLIREAQEEETEPVNVYSIIQKTVSEIEGFAQERDTEISIDCPQKGSEVEGGPLLKEVFSNLIENSVHHSEGSRIKISGEVEEDVMVCTVEDDGKGIPDDKKETIFEKGYTTDEERGTGLGLFLVKNLLESYDGEIEAKDSYMGGARFEIHLERIQQ